MQGRMQVLALNEIFAIEKIRVYSRTESSREKYASEMGERLGLDVQAVDCPRRAGSDGSYVGSIHYR